MALPPVSNWIDAVMLSITAALVNLLSFLPALIGAIVILVVGWLLAGVAGRLVTRLLERIGFEQAAQRAGISDFVARAGIQDSRASRIAGELVKWFVRLIFLEAAAEAIHLQAVIQIINSIALFIPNLVVALLVLMIGALIARFVGDMVRGSTAKMGFASPNLMALLARYGIMAFAVLVAVSQIGVAAVLVNILFMGLVGALALALGLAFGLGGRDVAGQMWLRLYERGQGMAPSLEAAAETAEARSPQPAPASAPEPQPALEPAPRYRVSTE
jgi:hypothetical protein